MDLQFTKFDFIAPYYGPRINSGPDEIDMRIEALHRFEDPPGRVRGSVSMRMLADGRVMVRSDISIQQEFLAVPGTAMPRIGAAQARGPGSVVTVPDEYTSGSQQFVEWLLGLPISAPADAEEARP